MFGKNKLRDPEAFIRKLEDIHQARQREPTHGSADEHPDSWQYSYSQNSYSRDRYEGENTDGREEPDYDITALGLLGWIRSDQLREEAEEPDIRLREIKRARNRAEFNSLASAYSRSIHGNNMNTIGNMRS